MRDGYYRITLTVVAFLAFAPGVAMSTTRTVPDDYPTIQSAIDAAVSGDSVLIGAGTYNEILSTNGRQLTICSRSGADVTIVTAASRGYPVLTVDAPGLLCGLTLTGAYNHVNNTVAGLGGGILVTGSGSITIAQCKIMNCAADHGGGIYVKSTVTAVITDCTVDGNRAVAAGIDPVGIGGGIYVEDNFNRSVTVTHSVITSNHAAEGGGISCGLRNASITYNRIEGNSGLYDGGGASLYVGDFSYNLVIGNGPTGVTVWGSSHVHHNTVVGNTAGAGFLQLGAITACSATVDHNIVAGTRSGVGIAAQPDCGVVASCNDLWNNEQGAVGAGVDTTQKANILADPLFCAGLPQNYTLSSNSPCSADPTCGPIGALGVACGSTASRRLSWGQLKRAYR